MNRRIPENYLEKVYAGLLGKIIGVRAGANIEMWSHRHIENVFGELDGYPHDFKRFAADDDTNGPVFFIRALEDFGCGREITSRQIGQTWLNYVPDGRRFLWWGGYGCSSEETAYRNLKGGIDAPFSGSALQNGTMVAEQIGGQIFIDSWGLASPGDPVLAAELAGKAAAVSHDGNGRYGGMFIAAAIAAAFYCRTVEEILEEALKVIPGDCEYARMVKDMRKQHTVRKNWRDCLSYMEEIWFDRKKYPGNCHIIPNGAIILLALLYGNGDFTRSINLSNMCGFDTDCNSGNVGTVMGVFCGLKGIEEKWRKPIGDFLCASSTIGSLNQLDIPACAAYIAGLGYELAGQEKPEKYRRLLLRGKPRYDFLLPGSSHGFYAESDSPYQGHVQNVYEAVAGKNCLKVTFDWWEAGQEFRACVRTDYGPEDFEDSRYDPCFSPILYPGQTVTAQVMVPESSGAGRVRACCYARDAAGKTYYGVWRELSFGKYAELSCRIPELCDTLTDAVYASIKETGICFVPLEGPLGEELGFTAYVSEMHFSGKAHYRQEMKNALPEEWNSLHINVDGFSDLRGNWRLEDGRMFGSGSGDSAETYTGDYYWKEQRLTAWLQPCCGTEHGIQVRVQGAMRSYAAALSADNVLVLYKNEYGYRVLAKTRFEWEEGKLYKLTLSAQGEQLTVSVDDKELIRYRDEKNPFLHGCVGFFNRAGAVSALLAYEVEAGL